MSVYNSAEWGAFVTALRKDAGDRTTALVAADWLDEAGKGDHAAFVRGCVRLSELRGVLDECAKMDLHCTDPTRSAPSRELDSIVRTLDSRINRHIHEWSGGTIRRFVNPTVYDWRNGFLRNWSVAPLKEESDRETDLNALLRLKSLVKRQPVRAVWVDLPHLTFAPPELIVQHLHSRFPFLEFRHGAIVIGPERQ